VPDSQKGHVRMRVIRVCKSLEESVELMGRTPKAIACGVICVVLSELGQSFERPNICKICDVSLPTLTKIETIIRAELKEKNLV